MSEAAALVEACQALIREIDIPRPFSMAALCDRLGRQWGSTVVLYPTATLPHGPCGMWVSLRVNSRVYDVFAYERDAPPVHQALMIFHEIGHRLLDHQPDTELPLDKLELVGRLFPQADPGAIDRIIGCGREPTAYDQPPERAAELFATLLQHTAVGWRPAPLSADAGADLHRLQAALGYTDPNGGPHG